MCLHADGQADAKMKTRLEKALAECQELRVRVAELKSENALLEASVKLKNQEVECAKTLAKCDTKTELQEKLEAAFERGVAFAERQMERFANLHRAGPPSSARVGHFSNGSRDRFSGSDQWSE